MNGDYGDLSEVEAHLRGRFDRKSPTSRLPSTAQEPAQSNRTDQLFLVRENSDLVKWERETRKFLRKLSPEHGHRVSAAMVFEWATGIQVVDLMAKGGSTVDLKRINKVLRFYFGKPYMTYICGRKVPNAFKVPPGWYVKRHRPMTLTLYAEYSEGTLNP